MTMVTLLPAGRTVAVASGLNIVDALRCRGIRMPYKCRRGGCGACKSQLVSGEVRYERPVSESVLSATERDGGLCLPCRAVPTTDVVLDLGDAPVAAVLATAGVDRTNPTKEASKSCP